MEPNPAQQDDTDFTIDLSPAAGALPPVEPESVPAGRKPLEMREIQEAIARVESEAKANMAAESRHHAESRARSLADERAALDAAAAQAAQAKRGVRRETHER